MTRRETADPVIRLVRERDRLRMALWDFVDVAVHVGPVHSGSAVWHHALRVLGERRDDEKCGRELR